MILGTSSFVGLNTLNLDPDPELVSSVVDPVYFHLFFVWVHKIAESGSSLDLDLRHSL